METQARKHAKFKIVDNIAVITLNSPNAKVNVINTEIMSEFSTILHDIETNPRIQAVILISDKPGCFIAGADINLLEKYQTADEATQGSRSCQQILATIESSEKPVVAAIQGSCLGAGLETALACHYRIAVKDKKTCLGLPEVLLGLLPGAGGTQRLQRATSLTNALDMTLTGKSVTAAKAKELGIVDLLIDPLPGLDVPDKQLRQYLEETAVIVAKKLVKGELRVDRNRSLYDQMLQFAVQYGWVKEKIFGKAREQIMKQSRGLYPAPLKILEVVRIGLDEGFRAGCEAEAQAFGELMMTPESKSLLSLYRAQTECKKNRFGESQNRIKNVGAVGAGLMGSSIAYLSVSKGFNVVLKATSQAALHKGINHIQTKCEDAVKRKRITSFEKDLYLSKLRPTLTYDDFLKADMVLEAVPEDIDLKRQVLRELEAIVPRHCIIATSTRAIPISKIAEESSRPDKIIGMHYFSPVDKMQLLEIVTTDKTSKDTIASAIAVGLKQGKVVITVRDGPGFYTTRVLMSMVIEAVRLCQEGVHPKHLNNLTKKFGFPVGIVTVMDEIGLDVIASITTDLVKAFGERFSGGNCDMIKDLVQAGLLGKKSSKGVFLYDKKTKDCALNPVYFKIIKKYSLVPKGDFSDEDKTMRLVSRFVNEAVLCLEEKNLSNPVEGNVGAVFGLGFPPFTGGPFRWVDSYGANNLVTKMKAYTDVYGTSFKPAQTLVDMANDCSKKFHPRNGHMHKL